MCGIAGVVGVAVDHSQSVRAMCDAMVHRGPDDSGYYDRPSVHLGMRRLAIIDVAHGAQPIANEDGSVVTVFNGEIYNYRSIQEQLRARGHTLATDSDTECLVHLYEDHGPSLVDRLRGMFGLAVWDRKTQTLLLARDRVGKKPLYYYVEGRQLWFASELKGLLAVAGIPREVDPQALWQYLTFKYVPNPMSIFRGIRKLPPGHRLTWRDGRVKLERYWSLDYPPSGVVPREEDKLGEEFRDLLLEATRIRMISERPLGAFLSGGLDSSAVVAAMARSTAEPIRTFSIGFAEDEFNELPHARRVADIYGTQHEELIVEPQVEDLLPAMARSYDEPFADVSAVPSHYLAEMAGRGVVVALNGDGGDESFGGYRTYQHFLRVPPERTLSSPEVAALGLAGRVSCGWPIRSTRLARPLAGLGRLAAGHPWQRYGSLMSVFSQREIAQLLRPEVVGAQDGRDPYAELGGTWHRERHTDPVNRMLAMDVYGYLPGDLLPKVDISTMAVSLEARSPFLDHMMMEWAARLPGSLKVRRSTTKYLMKRSLTPWLPQELIHRRKMGFGIPIADWLQGPLTPMVDRLLLDTHAQLHRWCRPTAVSRVVGCMRSGFANQAEKVWSLLMLEIWAREVLNS